MMRLIVIRGVRAAKLGNMRAKPLVRWQFVIASWCEDSANGQSLRRVMTIMGSSANGMRGGGNSPPHDSNDAHWR